MASDAFRKAEATHLAKVDKHIIDARESGATVLGTFLGGAVVAGGASFRVLAVFCVLVFVLGCGLGFWRIAKEQRDWRIASRKILAEDDK